MISMFEVFFDGMGRTMILPKKRNKMQETEPGTFNPQQAIAEECDKLKQLLIDKNKAYGNSALDPVRIFSRADPAEQIRVRIDDKLSRLTRGVGSLDDDEDTVLDLLGYLVLLRIALRQGGA